MDPIRSGTDHPDPSDRSGRADLSALHVVIPLRGLTSGKARLGGALDAEERETLILGMLRHELHVLGEWQRAEAVHVVSPDAVVLAEARAAGVAATAQRTGGLNEGLRTARAEAVRQGATALLILPGDLPLLGVLALDSLLDAADAALAAGGGRGVVVLAAADAGRGTNALLVSPPEVIEPCFGPHSLERHLRAAQAAQASVQVLTDPALGFDLDAPNDLERLDERRLEELVALGALRAQA